MTLIFLTALALLALSVGLVRVRFGPSWLLRPYSVFVVAAAVYHGVSEVVVRLTDADEFDRFRPPRDLIDDGMLVTGIALLVMTLAYLAAAGGRDTPAPAYDRAELARVIDWRLLAVPLVPLVAATVRGQGYQATVVEAVGDGTLTQGFGDAFLIPLLVLTGFGFTLRHPRGLVAALAVQSAVLALTGQRLPVLIAGVLLLMLTAKVGIRPNRRQLAVGLVVAALTLTALTSSRADNGRSAFQNPDTNSAQRATSVVDGILHPRYESVVGDNGPIADFGIRINANAGAGWTAGGLAAGAQPAGLAPLADTVLLGVPSFLYPEKVNLTIEQRSVKVRAAQDMGMPIGRDYLPGAVPYFYPALGFLGLLLFSAIAGLGIGRLDRWALASRSVAGFLVLLGVTYASLFYERGWYMWPLSARAMVVIGAVLWLRGLRAVSRRPSREAIPAQG